MKLATLLYIKNAEGEFLLMERLKEPNKGLMSPPGGKLNISEAESPSACAVREAYEECLLSSNEEDWKLRGIITEKNFPNVGNIMIFLMEYKKKLNEIPPACNEGEFSFIDHKDISGYKIPVTDKLFLWDKVINSGNGVFEMTLDCTDYPEIIQK